MLSLILIHPKPAHHQVFPSYKPTTHSSSHPGQHFMVFLTSPFSLSHIQPFGNLDVSTCKGIQTLTTSHHVQRCFPVWITIYFFLGFCWERREQKGNWEAKRMMVDGITNQCTWVWAKSGNGEGQRNGVLQSRSQKELEPQLSDWTAATIMLHSLYLTFLYLLFSLISIMTSIHEYLCIPLRSLLFYYSVLCQGSVMFLGVVFFKFLLGSWSFWICITVFIKFGGNVDTASLNTFSILTFPEPSLHRPLDVVPQVTGVLLGFLPPALFFPLYFITLAYFYCYGFAVTDIFFSHVYTAVKPSSIFFYFRCCSFHQ